MAKLTLSNLASITGNEQSAIATINTNSDLIETALENTLSRDGTTPNTMGADLDLNGYDLINVGNLFLDGDVIEADVIADYIDINEAAVPSAPSANTARFYAFDDGGITKLAYKDSAGTIHVLGTLESGYLDLTEISAPSSPGSNVARVYAVDSGGTTKVEVKDSAGVTHDLTHFTQSGTGATLRTQQSKLRDSWRSVKDFGAAGDGTTDDTVAIQAALDVGSTFDHGTVFFPDGTYMVAGLKLPSNCSLKGASRDNTTLKLKNGANTHILASKLYVENDTLNAFPDGQNFIENITFDGNKANNTSGSCLILRSYNAQVMYCDFQNAADHGIIQSAATANGSNPQNAAECVYKQCRIHLNEKHGMWFKDDSNGNIADAWIVDNWIHDNGTDGYVQVNIERGAGFHIHNNQIYSDYQGNLVIAEASGTVMSGNNLELSAIKAGTGNTYTNLEVALGLGGGANLGISIQGNFFHTFLTDIATNTYRHINFTGSGDATIIDGNAFRAPSGGWTNGTAIERTAASAITGTVGSNNFFQNFTNSTRGQGYYDLSRIVSISSGSGASTMTLASVNADAVIGPVVDLDRQSPSPTGGDNLGAIRFRGRDSGGGTDDYAYLVGIIDDATASSEDGRLNVRGAFAGADTPLLTMAGTGFGYPTGAGGAVTQATSRTTGVTLNKVCGSITLVSAAGGNGTSFAFTVTNSMVAANDVVIVSQQSGTDQYDICVTQTAAGSFRITARTLAGGNTTEQPVFNFAVIKAVAS